MKHLKILCVDDDNDLRTTLRLLFEAEDFEVDTAEDGVIALEKLKKNLYDLVLLDIAMPNMDGIAVLKEMKKTSPLPHVIMLSGLHDASVVKECITIGAKDYISKPYNPEDLLHTVIRVLSAK